MLSPADLAAYIGACALLALSPGPDNLFVLAQSMLHGARAGLWVVLGLCTGLLFHSAAVAFGVAVFFRDQPWAFLALKVFGASYLLYLAASLLRAEPSEVEEGTPPLSSAELWRRGLIMNITNPKVSLFFLAFLPQFADAESDSMTMQLLALGGIFLLTTFLVFGGLALAAGRFSDALRRSARQQLALNRGAALLFVVLAIRLVTSTLTDAI